MKIINTISGQPIDVEISVSDLIYAIGMVEKELIDKTQNIIVACNDAYSFINGYTKRSIGIRMTNETGGRESLPLIGDTYFLIAGTLRRSDNHEEIVSISDLMKLGYQSAYVELKGQSCSCGQLFTPRLGSRKIVDMHVIEHRAYLTLAPMT